MLRIIAMAVLAGLPGAASATSVEAHAYVYGPVPAASGGTEFASDADDRYSDDTVVTGPSRTAAALVDQGGAVYRADAGADVRTGVFSTAVNVAGATLPDNLATAEATAFETFMVSGNGAVTFRLGLDGGWDLPTFAADDGSGLLLLGRMYIAELYDADGADVFYRILRGPDDPDTTGAFTDELVHVLDVTDGGSYMFNTWVISELRDLSGAGSASLAGLLSVTPGPGVDVTFADPAFLSDGGTVPAPVPLPAPFALLLAGVGALGLVRKRAMTGALAALILIGGLSTGDPGLAQTVRPAAPEQVASAGLEEPQGGSNVPPPVWILVGLVVGILLIAATLNSSDAGAAFLPPA